MRQANVRKQKIELSDYNYLRDITNRLLMARLTNFEVDVLREILNASLKFTPSEMAEALDVDEKLLIPVLLKLSQTGLLRIKESVVSVDKEMRKYYEAQIVKFDEDFEPGMEFLQGLLSKVPIHHLPSWYAISRISDHIFQSILEKYLNTAKLYERYLQELEFDDPILKGIMRDVFSSPDFKIPSRDLIKKHGLTHEEFEEKMLMLEYSFACCIVYERVEDRWEEEVAPFHEWREYLCFLRDSHPKSIKESASIERFHASDFGFVDDLVTILKALPLEVESVSRDEENVSCTLSRATFKRLLPHVGDTPLAKDYCKRLIDKALALEFADVTKKNLCLAKKGVSLLKQCTQDQAHAIYCLPPLFEGSSSKFSDRDIREVEKSLKRIAKDGWIDCDSFIASLTAQIGKSEPVILKNKGKRWWYSIPSYSVEEKNFVKSLICEKFFDAGMVSIGTFKGALCFRVTPYGRMMLES